MNPREQFGKETGMTTGIMFAHSVGFRDEYVLWLEKLVETLLSNPEPTREELIEKALIFYEQKRISEKTSEITENPNPDYSLSFYQNIFQVMADFYLEVKKNNQ